MSRNRILSRMMLVLPLLTLPLTNLVAQDSTTAPSGAPQGDSSPQSGNAPAPAIGVDNQAMPLSDNPPITGLDVPGLEPHAAPLSYLQPALHFSEAADSNVADTLGGSALHSSTRALGSLELQRLWSHYALALGYLGGVGYYSGRGQGIKDIQQFEVEEKISWKRGQISFRDSFNYEPQGTFGGAYGASGLGLEANATIPGVLESGSVFGSLGQEPRITNEAVADVVESLSPKSSVTAAVGYGLLHFTGNTGVQGISFIGSQQFSAEGGYNRVLGRHDQLALVYAYQQFDFSVTGSTFHSNIVQAIWGHRISGRMDFLVGAGPQVTSVNTLQPALGGTQTIPPCENVSSSSGSVLECPFSRTSVSVAARASLRYKFPRTMLSLNYTRANTNGSGFFTGAETDHATLGVSRPLSRVWRVTADLGYSHSRREIPLTPLQQIECGIACPSGVDSNTFVSGFAGIALHRMLGRTVHVYASYQFNELSFDPSFCGFSASGSSLAPCSRISQRHVGTLGLDWTPRPIRLD